MHKGKTTGQSAIDSCMFESTDNRFHTAKSVPIAVFEQFMNQYLFSSLYSIGV